MNVKTFCSRVVFLGFSAATAASFIAPNLGAQATEQQNSSHPVAENRINPKHRQGREGSDEAKLDADQARELYIRRKHRLEEI